MDKQTAFNKTLKLYLEAEFKWYGGNVTGASGFDSNEWLKALSKYNGYREAMRDANLIDWDDIAKIEKHKVKIEKPE